MVSLADLKTAPTSFRFRATLYLLCPLLPHPFLIVPILSCTVPLVHPSDPGDASRYTRFYNIVLLSIS